MKNALSYSSKGVKKTTAAKLNADIFGLEVPDHTNLKNAYLSSLGEARDNHAVVKTRAMVSGGGRKPWKQKGTGRARFGSTRVPQWRHGGITHGPTGNENYTLKINKQAKVLALKQALSLMANDSGILVVESYDFAGKTKNAANLLANLKLTGNTTVVVPAMSDDLVMALRNLTKINIVAVNYLNAKHVLDSKAVLFSEDTLKTLELRLEGAK
jgi:large subunit ribosomal protein L4